VRLKVSSTLFLSTESTEVLPKKYMGITSEPCPPPSQHIKQEHHNISERVKEARNDDGVCIMYYQVIR
jgi:hypothetical protein